MSVKPGISVLAVLILQILFPHLIADNRASARLQRRSEQLSASQAFYVSPNGSDSNDGSAEHPWATVSHAANIVTAGATVHVSPGRYFGPIVNRHGGTPTRRIRFVSDIRWGAKVEGRGTPVIWSIKADAVTVEGFDVKGDRFSYYGIANYGSYGLIKGNHVHFIPAPACTGAGGAGIINLEYLAHDNEIAGNVVHDIGNIERGCSFVHGIYQSNRRARIVNNIVYRNAGYGIHTWHMAEHVTISNNLVFNNSESGIIIGAGDSPLPITADYFTVTNNIALDNREWGIVEKGAVGEHNRYANNLLFRNGLGPLSIRYSAPIHTITTNPEFLDYRWDGTGDYHLSPQSPAVDRGTAEGAPSLDFDGVSRPQGAALDIGVYECRQPSATVFDRVTEQGRALLQSFPKATHAACSPSTPRPLSLE